MRRPDRTARILSSIEEFETIEQPYSSLVREMAQPLPFWSHVWIANWWRAFQHRCTIRVFSLWEGHRLVAAVPLMFRADHLAGAPVMSGSFLGSSWALCDVMARDGHEWVEPLFAWLFGREAPRWQILQLGPMSPFSLQTAPLMRGLDELGLRHIVASRSNPYLPLDGTWEEFLNSKSKNFRRTIRRNRKALDEAGGFEFVRFSDPGPDELRRTVFEVSQASWQGKQGRAVAVSAEGRAFYEAIVGTSAREFECDVAALLHHGRCVAYLLGFIHAGIYHAFDTGYDPAYHAASPGTTIHMALLEHLFGRQLKEFNFGYEAAYKDRFDPLDHATTEVMVFRSRLWFAWNRLGGHAKQLLGR